MSASNFYPSPHQRGRRSRPFSAETASGRSNRWSYQIKPIVIQNKATRKNRPGRKPDLLVTRSVTSGLEKEITITIRNPSTVAYYLSPGTALADCTVIPEDPSGLDFPTGVAVGSVATTISTPDHPGEVHPTLQGILAETPVDNPDLRKRLQHILSTKAAAFSRNGELGLTDAVLHEKDTGDAEPIRQQPRRLPIFAKKIVDECMQEMLKKGVIKPLEEGSEWTSPIVLVIKKDASTRLCVDFRSINNITKKKHYPLHRIEDTLDSLHEMDTFSSLELKSAYHQLKMSADA